MNRFKSEIYEIAELLFSNGERIIETDSFVIEIYENERFRLETNWRKEIAKFLSEKNIYRLNVNIVDKISNRTFTLLELHQYKLKNLYMELLLLLDMGEKYKVVSSPEKILCSVSVFK